MLEFIVLVNLVFSVTGFFFILRMWKEVKQRRDYYGENFGIPKGKDMTAEAPQPPVQQQAAVSGLSMEQLNMLVNQEIAKRHLEQHVIEGEPQQKQVNSELEKMSNNGDLEKIVAATVAAMNGGANGSN